MYANKHKIIKKNNEYGTAIRTWENIFGQFAEIWTLSEGLHIVSGKAIEHVEETSKDINERTLFAEIRLAGVTANLLKEVKKYRGKSLITDTEPFETVLDIMTERIKESVSNETLSNHIDL